LSRPQRRRSPARAARRRRATEGSSRAVVRRSLCAVSELEDRSLARIRDCVRHRQPHDHPACAARRNPQRRFRVLADPEVPSRGSTATLRSCDVANMDAPDAYVVVPVAVVQRPDELPCGAGVEAVHAVARDPNTPAAVAPRRRGLPLRDSHSCAQNSGGCRRREQGQEREIPSPARSLRSECHPSAMRRQTSNLPPVPFTACSRRSRSAPP